MACCLTPSCCPTRNSSDDGRPASSQRHSTTAKRLATRRHRTRHTDVIQPDDPRHCDVIAAASPCPPPVCQHCIVNTPSSQLDVNINSVNAPLLSRDVAPVTSLVSDDVTPSTVDAIRHLDETSTSAAAVTAAQPGAATGNVDFMTLFFRNCEQIVRANADMINDLLKLPTDGLADDDMTSLESTFSSVSDHQQQQQMRRRRLSYSEHVVVGGSVDSATSGRHPPSVAPVVPVNSPVSSTTSSLSSSRPAAEASETADEPAVMYQRPRLGSLTTGDHQRATSPTCDSCGRLRRVDRPLCVDLPGPGSPAHRPLASINTQLPRHYTGRRQPVGLGSRPPCLGQECSPIRSNPCGAGTSSSTTTGPGGVRPTSCHRHALSPHHRPTLLAGGSTSRRHLERRSTSKSAGRRRCHHHRCLLAPSPARRHLITDTAATHLPAPEVRLPPPQQDIDLPSRPVVEHSCQKVDQWLRQHHRQTPPTPAPATPTLPRPHSNLKRKYVDLNADLGVKVRLGSNDESEAESCSLPSGTFTSDEEDDGRWRRNSKEVKRLDGHVVCQPQPRPHAAATRNAPSSGSSGDLADMSSSVAPSDRLPGRVVMTTTSAERSRTERCGVRRVRRLSRRLNGARGPRRTLLTLAVL